MQVRNTPDIHDFRAIGINYKKTDASLRGSFAVNNEQYEQLLKAAPAYGISEFFVLSTCNRTEIYGFAPSAKVLSALLCSATAGNEETFSEISYIKTGFDAVNHLFQVGAGLDSQILGDYEILGQIKIAVKAAKAAKYIGPFMERLVNSVLQASKAIKTHTALSGGTVSVAFAAVQYIREYLEGPTTTPRMACPSTTHMMTPAVIDHYVAAEKVNIEEKKIVLVGTGKIGKSACRNLVDYLGTHNITLINRTEATARRLAGELGLKWAPIELLECELAQADVVLVSTSSAKPVVLKRHLEGRGRKLVIDFSIPTNTAPDAQQLHNVHFVDVDRLSKIKDETLQQRKGEVPKAMAIIEEIIADFAEWCDMRKHVAVLKEVKTKLKSMAVAPVAADGENDNASDEKIQKIINALALRIRQNNTPGCHYIMAINEYVA
jgi:glutamyl-tRNA reductase